MEYTKEFNKDKTKVTIKFTDDNYFWDSKINNLVKEAEFEVVKKEEIYEKILKGGKLNLDGKYIKGFSLSEYRENPKYQKRHNIQKDKKVVLLNFSAVGAFFEAEEFGNIDFSFGHFKGNNISFEGSVFDKGVSTFDFSNFARGNINFSHIRFGEAVLFRNAVFGEGEIVFQDTKFRKGLLFFTGTDFFIGNVNFRFTYFGKGEINFIDVKSQQGEIDFGSAEFDSMEVLFFDAEVSTVRICDCILKGKWDMHFRKAKLLDLSGSTIEGIFDMGYYKIYDEEYNPNIEVLKVVNSKLIGNIYINFDESNLKNAIENQEYTTLKEKACQFRLFKENFRRLAQYDDEDKAYYWFKYHELRAAREFEKGDSLWNKIKKMFVFGFKRLAFEKMGKYGTGPLNVMVSMAVVVVLFSLLYLPFASLENIELPHNLPLWEIGVINSLYHSVITFLAIGYGHDFIRQTILGRILSGFEGFLGLFLMVYFTIAFARKVLR